MECAHVKACFCKGENRTISLRDEMQVRLVITQWWRSRRSWRRLNRVRNILRRRWVLR